MEHLTVVIALVGLLGIAAQWVAWRTRWPAIALMLAAGLLAGPATNLIVPARDFGELLEPVISLAVALILFEGGLSLNFRELRHSGEAVTRLVLIGVPVGWALGAAACYYVAGLVWPVAILFAGIMVVTGPTVVLPLLREVNIASRPRAILKWEAIVNDPLGALCAVLTYEFLRHAGQGVPVVATAFSMIVAALMAALIGFGTARTIAWLFPRGYVPEYLKAPVLLIAVLGTSVLANAIQQETGLLAVTVMGVTLANVRFASFRALRTFKENITVLLISGVFVLLSASLDLEVLRRFEWRFLLFIVALILIVRPATVLISLAFSGLAWRERLFIAWIAPRGIVAVAVSGLFALRLGDLGYSDGGTLVSLSFAVVVATIFAHGFSIGWVGRRLGLLGAGRRGLLIVGATNWSMALAQELSRLKVPVTIADTSWQRLSWAREAGIDTYHGEVLAETTHDRLDLNQFQVLVAVSDNEAYNALVCNEYAPEFGRDSVYQLGGPSDDDDPFRLPHALRGRALFASGLGVEDLAAREREGWRFHTTHIDDEVDFAAASDSLPAGSDLLLLVRTSGKIRFFSHASRPEPESGDSMISYGPVAEDRARRDEAGRADGAMLAQPVGGMDGKGISR